MKSEFTASLKEKKGGEPSLRTSCGGHKTKTWLLLPEESATQSDPGNKALSAPLTCLRWQWRSRSWTPSALRRGAVSSWPSARLPQMLRLHLSEPIWLLLISSVRPGSSPSPPQSVFSPGPFSPGRLPHPSGRRCSPSPRSAWHSAAGPTHSHLVF